MGDSLEWVKWNSRRWLTSEARARMTAAQRGIYRDLLDHQTIQGSVPSDIPTLAALACVTRDEMAAAWPSMAEEFEVSTEDDSRLIQPVVDEVRRDALDQMSRRVRANRQNGLKGGRPRSDMSKPNQNPSSKPTQKPMGLSSIESEDYNETQTKPNGFLRASYSSLISSSESKCSTEEENVSARATPEDYAKTIQALESQHPEGHNPRPQLTAQMVISRCDTADDCAAIVRDHAGWIPAWRAGRTVNDLHNWVSKWERGAQPPAPQAEKRNNRPDPIGDWAKGAVKQ